MKLYMFLSRIALLKKYTAKFMFVAFLGIHIPLFGVIGALVLTTGPAVNKPAIFLLTLGLTLLATTVTLFILNALVAPLLKTQQSLSNYLITKTIPELPLNMTDEMGMLMRDINIIVTDLHSNLDGKDQVIEALSHHLRAPAANIKAIISLAKGETDKAETARYFEMIEDCVDQQLKLMDELVDKYENPK